MDTPKLSVLLPVRNGEVTLQRALDSLWQQSFSDFEVVVVNDGSTDGTLHLLEACTDERVKIVQQDAGGIAVALNNGLRHCRAPLVARMDADDVAHPLRLEKQWLYMQQNSAVDVLSCRIAFDGDKVASKGYFLYVEAINELLTHAQMWARRFWDAPLAHPSVMYRKDAIMQAGGYSEKPLPEDYELWLRLFEKGCRFAKLPEVLLRWTDHPNRISRTHPNYHKKAFWKLKSGYFCRWLRHTYRKEVPQLFVWGETRKKSRSRYLLDTGLEITGRIGMEGEEREGITPYTSIPLLPKGTIMLVYVSNREGSRKIRSYLESNGFEEGINYFLMV